MKIPEYITKTEVKRVCQELGFRDWTQLEETVITADEASAILEIVNVKGMAIPAKFNR